MGTQVRVETRESTTERHLADIIEIITASGVTPAVKAISTRIFTTLAEAEARVHGIIPEEVHFHEVGAVDALVDIIGAAIALDFSPPSVSWPPGWSWAVVW